MESGSKKPGKRVVQTTHAKIVKKGKSQKRASLVVFDQNYVNTTEVASILIEKLRSLSFTESQYGSPDDMDPVDLGESLKTLFEPIEINELMESDLGQGIILGVFLIKAMHDAMAIEAEVMESMEDDEV